MGRISMRSLARSIGPVILSRCTIAIDGCTYRDDCVATRRNLISNNNLRSRMTKKCENITDITLSPKFHSGNNPRLPMEKWECYWYWYCIVRWNLILTIIPWSRCIAEYTIDIKTLTDIFAARNLAVSIVIVRLLSTFIIIRCNIRFTLFAIWWTCIHVDCFN